MEPRDLPVRIGALIRNLRRATDPLSGRAAEAGGDGNAPGHGR
jgi:hypothetical protein